MKKNYTFYAALLMGMLTFPGMSAQNSETRVERLKQVLTYGDWKDAGKELGIDTKNLPTQVKDFFYNNRGKLVKTVEGLFQLGDNPATILTFEKWGDIQPTKFTSYNYNEKDELVSIAEQTYQSNNGWYYNWTANDTLKVFTYDENGKIANVSEKGTKTTYKWKGEQLAAKSVVSTESDKLLSSSIYSEFVGEKTNLPQKEIRKDESGAYFVVNQYDENQQLTKSTTFALVNPKNDENGTVIDGEKGDACKQTSYKYVNNRLAEVVEETWNKAANKFEYSSKKATRWDEQKKGYETVAFKFADGEWKADGAPCLELMGQYDFNTATGDIKLEEVGPRNNSVHLSFKVPQNTTNDMKWYVYRNGVKLGTANLLEGSWQFTDNEVTNGNYDYYVMADTTNCPGDKPVSNIVSKSFNTINPKTEKVQVVESGKTQVADGNGGTKTAYVYRLTWKAPETLTTILGYNIYLNCNPTQPGARPHNKQLITMPYYELVMDKYENLENSIVIETVYCTDVTVSDAQKITLNPETEVNKDVVRKTQKKIIYGSSMGDTGSLSPSKARVNYYDADNKLIMTVNNGYMTGDDPDTEVVEHAGDYLPTQYFIYEYDEKGNLVSTKKRDYGTYSGYDKAWASDFKTTDTYKYDEKTGKLIRHEQESYTYEYDWEGENKVQERTFATMGNTHLSTITYSNFSDKGVNLPQYGLGVGASPTQQSYNRIYEFDYDEKGRLIEERIYKHGDNVEKDDNGVIIKADKGVIYQKFTYEYEGDMLKTKIKYNFKSKLNDVAPYSKHVYTKTAKGIREQNYTYTNYGNTNAWIESTMVNETVENNYLGNTAPQNLTVTDVEGKINTVLLSCDAPQTAYGKDIVYEVYRNGAKIGNATVNGSKITYEDNTVPNGIWHYLIKAASTYEGVDFNSSNIVKKVLNTELPAVTKISFPVNGVKENGDYQLVAKWEAPVTDFEILGYNVFVDVRSYSRNPTPVNGVTELKDTQSYEFTWLSYVNKDKTINIETVYPIGKAMSEKFSVTLSGDPVGIVATENTKHMVTADNKIFINGNYKKLYVYSANGSCVAQYSNTPSVDLTLIPNGVYVVKLVTAETIETLKIVKK